MRNKGFTLIELMIVIAIIAIIAAIAIPSLLRSRMAANETAAVGACKAFATAENIYRRTDWTGGGTLEFAHGLGGPTLTAVTTGDALYETKGQAAATPGLIDSAFGKAEGNPANGAANIAASPKAGYCFAPVFFSSNGTSSYESTQSATTPTNYTPNNPFDTGTNKGKPLTLGFGLSSLPYQYDGTGRNSFQISSTGVIYELDQGSNVSAHITANITTNWVVVE